MNNYELRLIAIKMANEIISKFPNVKFDENYLIAYFLEAISNSCISENTGA